jgi:hypothetical protein
MSRSTDISALYREFIDALTDLTPRLASARVINLVARLTSSMPALPTAGNLRHFGALHLVSQPPPRLSHGEPKGLVSIDLRRACHRHTLLDQVFVNSNLHCTIPFRAHLPLIRAVKCGRGSIRKWRNAGGVDTETKR